MYPADGLIGSCSYGNTELLDLPSRDEDQWSLNALDQWTASVFDQTHRMSRRFLQSPNLKQETIEAYHTTNFITFSLPIAQPLGLYRLKVIMTRGFRLRTHCSRFALRLNFATLTGSVRRTLLSIAKPT
jgi:hypothetical protein